MDKIKKIKNGFIKINVNEENTKKITNAKLIEMKMQLEKTNQQVDFSTTKITTDMELDESKMGDFDASSMTNAEDMIDVYIENVETKLDKKKLKEFVKGKK
jgi:LPS O-antigen subunit length determinant protein (WzzB/FepE family)